MLESCSFMLCREFLMKMHTSKWRSEFAAVLTNSSAGPKNLGIGKNAILAWCLHGGNNWKRACALFPASILPLRVSCILLHQCAGHLATVAMLTSTRIISGDDKTSQGIHHSPAWQGSCGSPTRQKSLISHSLICSQQKKHIISSILCVRIELTHSSRFSTSDQGVGAAKCCCWGAYHGQIWELCQQVTQPRDRLLFFDGILSNTQMPSAGTGRAEIPNLRFFDSGGGDGTWTDPQTPTYH